MKKHSYAKNFGIYVLIVIGLAVAEWSFVGVYLWLISLFGTMDGMFFPAMGIALFLAAVIAVCTGLILHRLKQTISAESVAGEQNKEKKNSPEE